MRRYSLIVFMFLLSSSVIFSQGRKVSLEKTNPEEYKKKMEENKKDPLEEKESRSLGEKSLLNTKSGFESTKRRNRRTTSMKVADTKDSTAPPTIANTSAIAHGESNVPVATAPKIYKYKAPESSVEYYRNLREKFAEEEKIRKEKEADMAAKQAKKEEAIRQSRRLQKGQASQFDKYREGATDPVEKKTTAEEDYKALFK